MRPLGDAMRGCWFGLLVMCLSCTASKTPAEPSDGLAEDTDQGVDTDSADSDAPRADPLEAPADTWTWIDIEGMFCADGSPTGVAVNLHPGATTSMIFLEGGGACWDGETCWGSVPLAFNLAGYDQTTFETQRSEGWFDQFIHNRAHGQHPLPDAHQIWVPYCTGDLHIGDRVVDLADPAGDVHPTHHVGRPNLDRVLEKAVPTFSGVDRVLLTGASAGGFGAALNWGVVREAFGGGVRVDLLDDSGPPSDPEGDRWHTWQTAWNAQRPTGCPECEVSMGAYPDHWLSTGALDQGRFGLLSYDRDLVISAYFLTLPGGITERLDTICADQLGEIEQANCFVVPGLTHTFLGTDPAGIEAEDGTTLTDWLHAFVGDDEEWATHLPSR